MVVESTIFYEALNDSSMKKMQSLPKSDLHNHAGRGGRVSYIEEYAKVKIKPFSGVFASIDEMNLWLKENINCHLPLGIDNYLKRVEASFVAASQDHIIRLALDFGLGEIYALGGMDNFIGLIEGLHKLYAPDTELLPVVVIRDGNGLEKLEEIFSYNWFYAIDIINYDKLLSMKILQVVCQYAKSCGMKCKAHVGEYGTAEDVWRYVNELDLDEIQHGIKVVESLDILKRLSERNLLYNVCPTSNIKLGLCPDYQSHPIKIMYDYGLKVTVNTDDLLIFNASISDEFMRLYHSGVLGEKELYQIYRNGMQK